MTSLALYKSNYSAPYRPANKLSKFRDNILETDDESEEAQTINHYGSLGGPVNGYLPNEFYDFDHILNDGLDSVKLQAAPKVGNPFDFPALPKKKEEIPAEDSQIENEDDAFEGESDDESAVTQTMTKLLKTEPQPAVSSVALTVKTTKPESEPFKRFVVDLDDAIFRCCFPPVVEDPEFKIPSPMLHYTSQQVTFEAHVSTVQSPHKFYFHYGDQDLFMLMNKMQKFYSQLLNDDLVMNIKSIRVGMVAGVKFDNTWHRAEVTGMADKNWYISMFLVDFGLKIRVHLSAVCYLPLMFTHDPVKALRGSIIDVSPKYDEEKWNPTTNEAFFGMVSNQKLKATIRRYRQIDDEYDIQLCVCYNKVWYSISALLVQRGQAAAKDAGDSCSFAFPLPVPV